jgi:hypothetical protein
MHLSRRTILVWLALVASTTQFTLGADKPELPSKDKFHLFLLVGQSNMAGRGNVEAEDKIPHPRVLMLNKAGEWVPAVDPLHFDKSVAGTGLGKTFGTLIAEANSDITVGLIPCAVGGSPIDSWKPGVFYQPTNSHPWDDALKRAKLALEKGTLKGILWHQGESDSNAKDAPSYGGKLQNLVKAFRAELGDVPFLVGQLGQFEDVPWNEPRKIVDRAHQDLARELPNVAFVSSTGLKHKGDKVHFDSASMREFGKRYAEAYLKLTKGQ